MIALAADPGGRPVAYADLERDGHIDHLYCHPDAGGHGPGTALLLTLETLARSRGLPGLYAEASETARPLFERLGFSIRHRRAFERDGVGLHNYSMSRELSARPDGTGPTPVTDALVAKYMGKERSDRNAPYHRVVAFGDSPEMMDNLAQLALSGTKRATAGLLRDFAGGEPMPHVGCLAVLLDGSGTPSAIWKTMELLIGPLIAVDAAFARDEGEGKRTRSDWRAMHRLYFKRQAERGGFLFHDHIPTVFERFEVVWSIAATELRRQDCAGGTVLLRSRFRT